MNLEERIALHTRMARAYGDAYLRQGVQDGDVGGQTLFLNLATNA